MSYGFVIFLFWFFCIVSVLVLAALMGKIVKIFEKILLKPLDNSEEMCYNEITKGKEVQEND